MSNVHPGEMVAVTDRYGHKTILRLLPNGVLVNTKTRLPAAYGRAVQQLDDGSAPLEWIRGLIHRAQKQQADEHPAVSDAGEPTFVPHTVELHVDL